jgi:hypothetical protein
LHTDGSTGSQAALRLMHLLLQQSGAPPESACMPATSQQLTRQSQHLILHLLHLPHLLLLPLLHLPLFRSLCLLLLLLSLLLHVVRPGYHPRAPAAAAAVGVVCAAQPGAATARAVAAAGSAAMPAAA